jgi:formate dehydrogenase iron-sulfur subunit
MKIYLPLDSAAVALGADEIAAAIRAKSADVTLVRNGSRGMVWLEPMVEVETPAGRMAFGPMTVADVPALFGDLAAHPKALGLTEELPWMKAQTRLTFARVGVIDPLSLADYRAHGGLKGLERALGMGQPDMVTEVTNSGLRGRGGAGFPTGIKWKTVSEAQADRKYIVCNADEGDSATFADRMLMEGAPFTLIEGMAIVVWPAAPPRALSTSVRNTRSPSR